MIYRSDDALVVVRCAGGSQSSATDNLLHISTFLHFSTAKTSPLPTTSKSSNLQMAKCNRKVPLPTTNYQLPSINYQLSTTNYLTLNARPVGRTLILPPFGKCDA